MHQKILLELARIEKEKNIKILYAVESGSRAWGFASQNSDWDVRFIYIHDTDWYLSIDDQRDTIEEMLPDDLDISGWELKKALKLFRKSNPVLLEWLHSPIIYIEKYTTIIQLRDLTVQYFSLFTGLRHYFHMAEGNYREYLQGDPVRIKKYFYVLRPLLVCDWIRQKETVPPVLFGDLLVMLSDRPDVLQEINTLLTKKMGGEELDIGPQIPILNKFLDEKINFYTTYFVGKNDNPMPPTEPLNQLFRNSLQEAGDIISSQ